MSPNNAGTRILRMIHIYCYVRLHAFVDQNFRPLRTERQLYLRCLLIEKKLFELYFQIYFEYSI